jgi:hypothetical protein
MRLGRRPTHNLAPQTHDLVKVVGAWRIADIKGPGGSLRDLMKVK